MILLVLSAAEALHIAERIEDAAVLDRICAQLRFDAVFTGVVDEPKTILFRDDGAGLKVCAISYVNAAAADAAEDRFWQMVLEDAKRFPLLADHGGAA